MRIVMFYHSLVSDWNHGNAHFLRGVVSELLARGHDVRVFEPEGGWSRTNLVHDGGQQAIDGFHAAYPGLRSETYTIDSLDLAQSVADADVVLVHEWNDHDLVAAIGEHHAAQRSYTLLFHDTHHRSVTDPAAMSVYDLECYDGVLAFGDSIRQRYLERRWAKRVWTWHEAADDRIFYPRQTSDPVADIVWIGNWGDDERTAELDEFLLGPVADLGLTATVYGVRYPAQAIDRLARAGVRYGGWLPNYEVPLVFARHKVTVHVPRRPYIDALPGIPTIRPFEALACGIPLVSACWEETGGMFQPGDDFLVAHDRHEMTGHLNALVGDDAWRRALAEHGLSTIRARHTCSHRVDQLLDICAELRPTPVSIQ